MFRAESMPTHYPAGFFDFADHGIVPLLERLRQERGEDTRFVAQHVIAPGLAPSDIDGLRRVTEGSLAAEAIIGPEYIERIERLSGEVAAW
jgi:hypothetical protein